MFEDRHMYVMEGYFKESLCLKAESDLCGRQMICSIFLADFLENNIAGFNEDAAGGL